MGIGIKNDLGFVGEREGLDDSEWHTFQVIATPSSIQVRECKNR